MSSRETPALWEEALEGIDTDALTEEIIETTVRWAGGHPQRLADAARILAESPYLEGGRTT